MMPTSPPPRMPEHADEITLAGVIDTFVSHRWLIACVTAACVGAGTLYAFLTHPQYQADILLQIEDSGDASAAKSLLGDVSSLFDVKSTAAAEAQILASRLVVTRAVDDLRSYIDVQPKRFPVVGDFISRFTPDGARAGVPGIGGYAWGNERADLSRFDVPKPLDIQPSPSADTKIVTNVVAGFALATTRLASRNENLDLSSNRLQDRAP